MGATNKSGGFFPSGPHLALKGCASRSPTAQALVSFPPGDEEWQLQMPPGTLASSSLILISPPVLSPKDFAGHPGSGLLSKAQLSLDPVLWVCITQKWLGLQEGDAASRLVSLAVSGPGSALSLALEAPRLKTSQQHRAPAWPVRCKRSPPGFLTCRQEPLYLPPQSPGPFCPGVCGFSLALCYSFT